MDIINYEIKLINNLYEKYKLDNNNIKHQNIYQYYIFNYIIYLKKYMN